MLKIKINNKEVYLEKSESLRLEISSGYFDPSSIPSPKILPFNIPIKKNEDIFDWMHLINKKKELKVLDCVLTYLNVPLVSSKIYVTKTSEKFYRASIIINGFTENFNKTSLSDLEIDPIVIDENPPNHSDVVLHATNVLDNLIDAPYRFPLVAAENFYGNVNSDGLSENNTSYGNQEIDISGRFFNLYDPINEIYHSNEIVNNVAHNEACLVPMFKLIYIVDKIFQTEHYKSTGTFLTDEAINKLLIMNNRTIDKKYSASQSQASRSIESSFSDDIVDFTENEIDPENNYSNNRYTVANAGTHEISFSIEYKNPDIGDGGRNYECIFRLKKNGSEIDTKVKSCNSDIYYKSNIIFSIQNCVPGDYFELYAEGSKEMETDPNFWEPVSTAILLKTGLILYRNLNYSSLNLYETSIWPANHLPDISLSKFLTSIKQTFGLVYFFDTQSKDVSIDFFNNIILNGKSFDISNLLIDKTIEEEYLNDEGFELKFKSNDIKDISGFNYLGEYENRESLPANADLNDCALVIDENAYFTYIFDQDDEFEVPYWKFYSDNLQAKTVGKGTTKFSPNLAPAKMTKVDRYLVPKFNKQASSPTFNQEVDPMDLELLFDGEKSSLIDDATGTQYSYPFATSQNLDIHGNDLNNIELNWEYLYENYLSEQLSYTTKGIIVTAKLRLEIENFLQLIKLFKPQLTNPENYRFLYANGKKFLPEKLIVIFQGDSIKNCEIKMRRRINE